MRILVLTNLYPPAAVGGYERMCRDVVTRFRERGHEISILTSTFGAPHDETGDDAESVHRRLGIYWDGVEIVCPPLRRQIPLERTNQRELSRLLRSFRPDRVSVWGMGGISLGLLSTLAGRRLPTTYVVGDDWLVFGGWADCWTRRLGERPLRRLTGGVLRLPGAPASLGSTGTFCFVSEFTRRRAEEVAGLELRNAPVISAGIETREFPLARPDERPWRWRLLCVGRLQPAKGFDTAIRALRALPSAATLTIVGNGDSSRRDDLARLARDIGVADRVRFLRSERSEMRTHYRSSDVLLFPSTGHEAFGLVPIEAMACATPVIATGVGGSAEFLADESNCLLVAPADAKALADAVRRLSRDASLREQIIDGGLHTAARLTVDHQADALEELHRLGLNHDR
jgi:glycogen(starch) synthase